MVVKTRVDSNLTEIFHGDCENLKFRTFYILNIMNRRMLCLKEDLRQNQWGI